MYDGIAYLGCGARSHEARHSRSETLNNLTAELGQVAAASHATVSSVSDQRESIMSRDGLPWKLQSLVIAIEFALMTGQPLFAHPRQRWFAHDTPYPRNNHRQHRPAE